MPVTYRIDEDERVVRVLAEGAADVAHVADVARTLAADLAPRPGWPLLCDCRQLSWLAWPNEIRQIASILFEFRSVLTGPIAVVLARPAAFGMTRMLSTLIEPFGIHMMPFWDGSAAERWCEQVRGQAHDDGVSVA